MKDLSGLSLNIQCIYFSLDDCYTISVHVMLGNYLLYIAELFAKKGWLSASSLGGCCTSGMAANTSGG